MLLKRQILIFSLFSLALAGCPGSGQIRMGDEAAEVAPPRIEVLEALAPKCSICGEAEQKCPDLLHVMADANLVAHATPSGLQESDFFNSISEVPMFKEWLETIPVDLVTSFSQVAITCDMMREQPDPNNRPASGPGSEMNDSWDYVTCDDWVFGFMGPFSEDFVAYHATLIDKYKEGAEQYGGVELIGLNESYRNRAPSWKNIAVYAAQMDLDGDGNIDYFFHGTKGFLEKTIDLVKDTALDPARCPLSRVMNWLPAGVLKFGFGSPSWLKERIDKAMRAPADAYQTGLAIKSGSIYTSVCSLSFMENEDRPTYEASLEVDTGIFDLGKIAEGLLKKKKTEVQIQE